MMATTMRADSDLKSTQRPAGRWIPWVFVGLFGVVLVANGTMITVAITTFTGMETVSAYKKGIDYNKRLEAAAKQEALGWQAALDAEAGDAGQMVMIFALDDRDGAPVAAADVLAKVDRPLQDGLDRMVVFDEIESGRYRATIDLPLEGQWEVQIDAVARGDRYQLTKRIMAPK